MSSTTLARLAEVNPIPGELEAIPLEMILARIEADPLGSRGPGREPAVSRRGTLLGALSMAVGVAVALVVAGVVLLAGRRATTPGAATDRTVALATTGDLEVFQHPQTARDRTLFPAMRAAARRAGESNALVNGFLDGVIPDTTRYLRTVAGGAELFVAELTSPTAGSLVHDPTARPEMTARGEVPMKFIVVQPQGRAIAQNGSTQPFIEGGLGEVDARIAGISARPGFGGCTGHAIWSLMPNGVARVRWQFPRQDVAGTVYARPFTVTVAANDNLAYATLGDARASCDQPTVATLLAADGRVLHRYGNPAGLWRVDHHRVTRPATPVCETRRACAALGPSARYHHRFPRNAAGETYGSSGEAGVSHEPDLISAVGRPLHGSGHVTGYVLRRELNAGSCDDVRTPRAALRCQAARAGHTSTIPLYARNGRTVIGTFTKDY